MALNIFSDRTSPKSPVIGTTPSLRSDGNPFSPEGPAQRRKGQKQKRNMNIAKYTIAAIALLGMTYTLYAAYAEKHCNYIPAHRAHNWTENGVTYHCGG